MTILPTASGQRICQKNYHARGFTATFIIRIDDVTDDIINQVNGLKEDDRNKKVKEISEQLIKKAIEGTHYSADIKPFYYGNKYFMIVTETFKDVRMVGAPPSSIGKVWC
ncbi:MAG: S46 family peptidase [Bacteroidia bacterium]